MKRTLAIIGLALVLLFIVADSYHQRDLHSRSSLISCEDDPGIKEIRFESGITLVLDDDSGKVNFPTFRQTNRESRVSDVLAAQDTKKKFFTR